MAVGRLLQMIALAIALLSSATTAIKINMVNYLNTPFLYNSVSGAGRNYQQSLREKSNATINIQADEAMLTMRKSGYYSGPSLKFHYQQANGEITYNLNGMEGDPFIKHCRKVIPSDKNCPHIRCGEGGNRCQLTKEHSESPIHSCGGTSEFTVIIGEPFEKDPNGPPHTMQTSVTTRDHTSTKKSNTSTKKGETTTTKKHHHSTKKGETTTSTKRHHPSTKKHTTSTKKHHHSTKKHHHSTKKHDHSTKKHDHSTKKHHTTSTKKHHSTTKTMRDPTYTHYAALTTA